MTELKFTASPLPGASYRLEAEMWLPRPLIEVFEFFSNAANLQRITPDWVNFQVKTPTPIEVQKGTLIDYTIRMYGIPMPWRTLIDAWEPPYRFVDIQLRGPYRTWHHEHLFEERDGGTLVKDLVDYAVPGGAVIEWLIVRRDVKRIFEYRTQSLARILGQPNAVV